MVSDADVAEVRHVVQRILVPCVFVIGLLGNSVSIYVLTRKRMRCTTNIYLTALAVTDIIYLMLILLLSFKHYDYVQQNCKLFYQLYGVFVWLVDACAYISIYIAVCFTIERFIAIRYPLKRQTFCTESLAKKVITGVALFCLLSTISTQFEHTYTVSYTGRDVNGKPCNLTLANVTPRTTQTMLHTTRRLPVTVATFATSATTLTATPILTTGIDDWLWSAAAGSGYGDFTLTLIEGQQGPKLEQEQQQQNYDNGKVDGGKPRQSIVMPSERRFMTRQTPEAVILSNNHNNNVHVDGGDEDDIDEDADDDDDDDDDIDMPLSATLPTITSMTSSSLSNIAVADVVAETELRQVADIPSIVTTTQSFDKQQHDADATQEFQLPTERTATTTTTAWTITMRVSEQLRPTELPAVESTTTTTTTATEEEAGATLSLQRRALQQQQQQEQEDYVDHNIEQAEQEQEQEQQQYEALSSSSSSSAWQMQQQNKMVQQQQQQQGEHLEYDNDTFAYNITEYCQNVTIYKNAISTFGQNDLYNHIWSMYTMFVFVLIPLSVLATFNCILIMLVRRSKNLRSDLTNANSIRRVKRKSTSGNSTISQENRVTVTLIAVVLLFIVCQLPWAIYLIISLNVEIEPRLQAIIGNIFNLLAAINAASNFFLYCVLSDKYRKTVRELITGYRRRHRHAANNASLYTSASTYVNGSRRFRNSTSMSILAPPGGAGVTTTPKGGGKSNAGALIT